MITPAAMMEELLNNSCSNPAYYKEGFIEFGDPSLEGYNRYRIELHCVEYVVTAKKVMGHYVIKSFEKVDC